jgi:hypothetical protein
MPGDLKDHRDDLSEVGVVIDNQNSRHRGPLTIVAHGARRCCTARGPHPKS